MDNVKNQTKRIITESETIRMTALTGLSAFINIITAFDFLSLSLYANRETEAWKAT